MMEETATEEVSMEVSVNEGENSAASLRPRILRPMENSANLAEDRPKGTGKRKAGEDGMIHVDDSSVNHENWRRLYFELQSTRLTAPEAQLRAHVAESKKQIEILTKLNQQLEASQQSLQKELSREKQSHMNKESTFQNQMAEQEQKIKRQEQQIRIYRQLTSTSLTNFDKSTADSMACDCLVENKTTASRTSFRLAPVPSNNNDLMYEPLENPKPLPEFLHESIAFEKTELTTLVSKVLGGMFPDEEEEADA